MPPWPPFSWPFCPGHGDAAVASVTVPNVVGKNEADARAALTKAGLVPDVKHVYGDFPTTSGLAYAQTPEGDTTVYVYATDGTRTSGVQSLGDATVV